MAAHLRMEYPVTPPQKQFALRNFRAKNPHMFKGAEYGTGFDSGAGPHEFGKELAGISSSSSSSSACSGHSSSSPSPVGSRPNLPTCEDLCRPPTPATPPLVGGSPSRIVHPKMRPADPVLAGIQAATIAEECARARAAKLELATADATAAASAREMATFASQHDYLQFVEPAPVVPPSYESVPPGGCPRYPVMAPLFLPTEREGDSLPRYSPAIYKIGVVSRKLEWLTPYEPSTLRSWRYMVMELNSTQVNFYLIPGHLETHVVNYQATAGPSAPLDTNDLITLNLPLTLPQDREFYRFCQRLGITTSRNLIRLYTLQHLKMGLAADYKKRPNILRLRLESEQILLDFPDTRGLIDWHFALGVGKDVSLDLQDREIPRYRTVPRRRRNRNSRNAMSDGYEHGSSFLAPLRGNRQRSQSDAVLDYGQSLLKSRLSRITSKLKMSAASGLGARSEATSTSSSQTTLSSINTFAPDPMVMMRQDRSHTRFVVTDDDEDEAHRPEEEADDDEEEEDVEDEDEEEECDFGDTAPQRPLSHSNAPRLHQMDSIDRKWDPWQASPTPSMAKHYRNCIRCIKPLNADDLWVGKVLVKPTTMSPVNMQYIRAAKCSAYTDLGVAAAHAGSPGAGKRVFSYKDIPSSDSALPRIPHHFVKEFTVGAHGLVPKSVG